MMGSKKRNGKSLSYDGRASNTAKVSRGTVRTLCSERDGCSEIHMVGPNLYATRRRLVLLALIVEGM